MRYSGMNAVSLVRGPTAFGPMGQWVKICSLMEFDTVFGAEGGWLAKHARLSFALGPRTMYVCRVDAAPCAFENVDAKEVENRGADAVWQDAVKALLDMRTKTKATSKTLSPRTVEAIDVIMALLGELVEEDNMVIRFKWKEATGLYAVKYQHAMADLRDAKERGEF